MMIKAMMMIISHFFINASIFMNGGVRDMRRRTLTYQKRANKDKVKRK